MNECFSSNHFKEICFHLFVCLFVLFKKKYALFRVSHIHRYKRDVSNLLIAPGTKWCGPSNMANHYVDIGFLFNLDKCCRKHDHCPLNIQSLASKYNFFNYRPFTLNHCTCDMRYAIVSKNNIYYI